MLLLFAVAAPHLSASDVAASDVVIMMNGLPGSMGIEVAEACARRGMAIAPVALSGAKSTVTVASTTVELVPPGEDADRAMEALASDCDADGKILIAIDYTTPAAAVPNAELYARHGVSFVMGTTGGDREALAKSVLDGGNHCAVIAPNMAKQIVAVQAALAYAAAEFPGAFDGYALDVIESHQATKKDTSGTAKAVVASLVDLIGNDHDKDDAVAAITRVRDSAEQVAGAQNGRLQKVPEDALGGHAYHTYGLTSADNSVRFELRHNVNGRRVYAEGSADAAFFLARRVKAHRLAPLQTRLFDMIDVLKSGELA